MMKDVKEKIITIFLSTGCLIFIIALIFGFIYCGYSIYSIISADYKASYKPLPKNELIKLEKHFLKIITELKILFNKEKFHKNLDEIIIEKGCWLAINMEDWSIAQENAFIKEEKKAINEADVRYILLISRSGYYSLGFPSKRGRIVGPEKYGSKYIIYLIQYPQKNLIKTGEIKAPAYKTALNVWFSNYWTENQKEIRPSIQALLYINKLSDTPSENGIFGTDAYRKAQSELREKRNGFIFPKFLTK